MILIAGPVQQGTYFPMHQYQSVESAQEMFEVASAAFVHADAAILTAAVADYTPEQVADEKIKMCIRDRCLSEQAYKASATIHHHRP